MAATQTLTTPVARTRWLKVTTVAVFCSLAVGVNSAEAYRLRKATTRGEVGERVVIWKKAQLAVVVDMTTVDKLPGATQAVRDAFKAWTDSGLPYAVTVSESATAIPHGFDKLNVVRWVQKDWTWGEEYMTDGGDAEDEVPAYTISSYDRNTGLMLDADMVINAAGFRWKQGAAGQKDFYDIQAVVTHEAGHFFGLTHPDGAGDRSDDGKGEEDDDDEKKASLPAMSAVTLPGDESKRTLQADDLAGVAALVQEIGERGGLEGAPSTAPTTNSEIPAPGSEADVAAAGGCAAGGGAESSAVAGLFLLILWVLRRRVSGVRRVFGARVVGASLVAGLAFAAPAQATVVHALKVDQVVAKASLVVRGRVVGQESRAVGKMIYTDYTVAVGQCLKGLCQQRVVVRVPGGTLGDLTMAIEGAPQLAVGEEVIVCGRTAASEAGATLVARPIGLSLGLFRLSGGVAVRDLRGLGLLEPGLADGLTRPKLREGLREVYRIDDIVRTVIRLRPELPVQMSR